MTGDWRAYPYRRRGPVGTVRSHSASAATQRLGAQLAARNIHGFPAPSTHDPAKSNLIVFPAATAYNPASTVIDPVQPKLSQ